MNSFSETFWVIINTRSNELWLHYKGWTKKEVIENFMEDETEGLKWKEFSKKYNWDCIKVKANFEQINKTNRK